MKKILCYYINNTELYLEQTLAEYDYPVLYTCISATKQRYLAMCVDPDEGKYFVAETTTDILLKMMNDIIPMNEAFKNAKTIYEVVSNSEDVHDDSVRSIHYEDISDEELPDEGAFFELLDSEFAIKEFVKNLTLESQYNATEHFRRQEYSFTAVLGNILINNQSMKSKKLFSSVFSLYSVDKIIKQLDLIESFHVQNKELIYEHCF